MLFFFAATPFVATTEVTITFRFGLPNKANSYDATRQKPYEPFHVPNDVKGGHGDFKTTF